MELVLEANPKWGLLVSILDEIDAENVDGGTSMLFPPSFTLLSFLLVPRLPPLFLTCATAGDAGRVLIAVRDERTCTQLQEYLFIFTYSIFSFF